MWFSCLGWTGLSSRWARDLLLLFTCLPGCAVASIRGPIILHRSSLLWAHASGCHTHDGSRRSSSSRVSSCSADTRLNPAHHPSSQVLKINHPAVLFTACRACFGLRMVAVYRSIDALGTEEVIGKFQISHTPGVGWTYHCASPQTRGRTPVA